MLIRIVRMHFTDAGVDEFLSIFSEHRKKIGSFPGCTQLELLRDADDPNCFATMSHWNSAEDLEAYRKSELFAGVWGQVKTLFSERTQAFSLEKFVEA
jgi:quinol monooxygenase YgiN